jgi:hypothetical protein
MTALPHRCLLSSGAVRSRFDETKLGLVFQVLPGRFVGALYLVGKAK